MFRIFLVLLLLTGCAQQPKDLGVEVYETDFSSGIDLVASYFDPGFFAVDCSNSNGLLLHIWLIQQIKTPTVRVKRETLIYSGDSKLIHKQYKLSPSEGEGTLSLNILNENDTVLITKKLK